MLPFVMRYVYDCVRGMGSGPCAVLRVQDETLHGAGWLGHGGRLSDVKDHHHEELPRNS